MTALLPDLAPFAGFGGFSGGCRGVYGPVPQPLLMSAGMCLPANLDKFGQFIMPFGRLSINHQPAFHPFDSNTG